MSCLLGVLYGHQIILFLCHGAVVFKQVIMML